MLDYVIILIKNRAGWFSSKQFDKHLKKGSLFYVSILDGLILLHEGRILYFLHLYSSFVEINKFVSECFYRLRVCFGCFKQSQ
jgi:hypothetical protein